MHAVTALIPVKEYVPEYLREAVGSLLAQSSPRWRALVIHPPGARAELQAQLGDEAADARIELVEEKGRNLAGALNTGMRAARTEFTSILFADDLWAPEAVAVLERNIAAHPDVDFFHSARRIIDDDGRPISGIFAAREAVSLEDFVVGTPVKHLLCWRRELALSIGGIDEELESVGSDDWDFRSAADDSPAALYAWYDGSVERARTRLDEALAEGGLDQLVDAHDGEGNHASLRRLVCDLVEVRFRGGRQHPPVPPLVRDQMQTGVTLVRRSGGCAFLGRRA